MTDEVAAASAAPVAPAAAAPAAAPSSPSAATVLGPTADAPAPAPAADAAPAASSEAAPAAEAPQSILSGAQGEKPAEPAPAEAPAAEKPAEPVADAKPAEAEKPAEAAKPEPPAKPVYEALKLPDGVKFDDAKVTAFDDLVAEQELRALSNPAEMHAAFADLRQKLADLYVTQAREDADRFTRLQKETWERTQEEWQTAFRNDPQLGRNRQETTLTRMGGLMDLYGSQVGPDRLSALRDVFTMTGAGNHLEVLRFVNWAASRLTETARVVTPMMPRAPVPGASRAARLYRNTGTNQGAA